MKLIKIPRNIFHTHIDPSWQEHNPHYAYFVYCKDECETFLQTHFEERVYHSFCHIKTDTIRILLWSFCIVYVYGGLYVGHETKCLTGIDNLFDEHVECMIHKKPSFLASVARHPILWECIHRIMDSVEKEVYPDLSFRKESFDLQTVVLLGSDDLIRNSDECVICEIKREPTIISMFYDIREKEDNFESNRSFETCLHLAEQFILSLPYNLVVFTDNDRVKACIMKKKRDKVRIYDIPFESTYYYTYARQLEELQKNFHILNGNPNHETPMYIVLNNNKFFFIEEAIRLNPFQSHHFLWMDFAINHVALDTQKIHEYIYKIPDQIKQLCICPYLENLPVKDMFQKIYHHMAGGFFSGSAENMLLYCRLFREKTEQIYSEGWYQIDEAVMTMIHKENPQLFSLYYGDYAGIISNYASSVHNIDTQIMAVQKCLDHNNVQWAYDILCFLDTYFENDPENNPYIFDFILQHIVVDYYMNDKKLTNSVIQSIHSLQKRGDQTIEKILKHSEQNLNFYTNKKKLTRYSHCS